jgi:hypothetical protein
MKFWHALVGFLSVIIVGIVCLYSFVWLFLQLLPKLEPAG